jgi:peptide/nickel transport system substrate-binding protein
MPQYGGVFRRAEIPAKALNFLDNPPQEVCRIICSAYNKLLDWEFEGGTRAFRKPGPSLAKSWTVSGDGTVWTFKLQEGVKFHDGAPFTSADVKANGDYWLNPGKYGPPQASYFNPYVQSVEAPDPLTIVLKLKAPTPILLDNLSLGWMMMAPKRGLEQGVEWFNTNAIGTGPFKWNASKWERGISYHLDRNPNYWEEGLPYLDGIVVYGIPDTAAQIAAFETKKIDSVKDLTPSQRQALLQRYGAAIQDTALPGFAFEYLIYNVRKPPFENVKVRQALHLWMDRAQYREKTWQGEGYLGSWIEPNHYPGYGTPIEELVKSELALRPDKTEARAKAKQILAEAGYTDFSKFGKIRVLPFRNIGIPLAGAQVAAAQLRELGFDAVVESKEALAFTQALGAGDFEVTYYNGGVGYSAPDSILDRYLGSKGQRNYSGLVDTTLDNYIRQVTTTADKARRQKLMAEMEQYLMTGQNATHLMFYRVRTVQEWNWLRGHRYISTYQEEMNTRTWLASDAPTRK